MFRVTCYMFVYYMKYFIANWKANKNYYETSVWLDVFLDKVKNDKSLQKSLQNNLLKIIIVPPSPFLIYLGQRLKEFKNIYPCVQDLSMFESGSYTGELTAQSLQGLVDYAIIGHSERRSTFNETDALLEDKVKMAQKYHIEPIFCVRDEKDTIPNGVNIIAYEPVYSIGSGNNEDPINVKEQKSRLNLSSKMTFVYGGSVTKDNAQNYLADNVVDGFLIGGASLDPIHFYDIVKLA